MGVCNGDSGSGLYFKSNDRKYYIRGIVSLTIQSEAGGCNSNLYSLYTKVSTYLTYVFDKTRGLWYLQKYRMQYFIVVNILNIAYIIFSYPFRFWDHSSESGVDFIVSRPGSDRRKWFSTFSNRCLRCLLIEIYRSVPFGGTVWSRLACDPQSRSARCSVSSAHRALSCCSIIHEFGPK